VLKYRGIPRVDHVGIAADRLSGLLITSIIEFFEIAGEIALIVCIYNVFLLLVKALKKVLLSVLSSI